ncbi:MAG TPA: DNA primase [Acidimicrobiales bacterium]|nr:DNA primase [Acidimicrobiales bacterium]
MGIVDDDVARVRETADLAAIVSQYVTLRRVGRRFQGLCPFHAEKSPSFSVNAEAGLYYCFGCQAKGDAITFVREIEHLDFVGAVEWLAAKQGLQLRYTDRNEGESRQRRKRLVEAVGTAVDWYHERLLTGADAGPARAYLRSRGFDRELVARYRIGWAPDSWDELVRALRLPDDVLRDTGLGFRNRRDRQQDAFRGRVMFPIFDVVGDPVGFGGRILPGAEGPKYKNSESSALYEKSRVLYGLNWAKTSIVETDEAVVCEGYTDVIGFAQAGVPRAVATCGTALTESHVQVLRKFARRVVLAFDADAAGQAAAERFYEWERTFEIDVAVADLPRGVDPADLARRDPDALRAAVEGAVPFLQFRLERVLGAAALGTAEGRARAAEAALAVIAEHPNDLVRDQYVMEVADRLRIDPDRLRAGLTGARRSPRPVTARDRRPAAQGSSRRDSPALEALRLVLQRPDDMVDLLHPALFDDEVHAAALEAVRAAGGDVRAAIDGADPDVAELLSRLAVDDTDAEPLDVAIRLVQEAANRALLDLEADARHSDDPLAYVAAITWLKQRAEELREPDTARSATEQLLAWLTQRVTGEP